MQYDILITGAGLVGLATAYQLQSRRPDLRIAVLDKEDGVAQHQSSHNSGVIHSGIYYRPGSLRAMNCLRGYGLLLHFCRVEGIAHEVCGKIIAAVTEAEREALHKLLQRGREHGLQGLKLLDARQSEEMEPHIAALESLFVPQTGIVDYPGVAERLASKLRHAGCHLLTQAAVHGVAVRPGQVVAQTSRGDFQGRVLVNCAGLYADKIARMAGIDPGVQIVPFRGEYYELAHDSRHFVRNLIYPVPNPNFPFLGVHFTRMVNGEIEAGPNAVLAFRREGYSRWDAHFPELWETLRYPGFQKIARKFWRDGWAEMQRSYSKRHFLRALRRLVPALTSRDLVPGRSGVRAMACSPDGNLLDDFLILEHPRQVHVVNAPSPAATACLAIGETVAAKVLHQC